MQFKKVGKLWSVRVGLDHRALATAELTESLADALDSAGCDDATPGTCEGILPVDFHREAISLEEAIRTAIENVRRAGLEVDRVEIDAAAVGPAA